MSTRATVFQIGFVLSAVGSGTLGILFVLNFLGELSTTSVTVTQVVVGVGFIATTAVALAGTLFLFLMERGVSTLHRARVVARFTMFALVGSVAFAVIAYGLGWLLLIYLYQIGWLIYFQLATDPRLDRSTRFRSPWAQPDHPSKGYIPLNFFNVFWVFMVASVVGLLVEDVWHMLLTGAYEDRAGLLWGPFSPIYGFGAALMTIALNRFWKSHAIIIFAVAGVIGAAFEFWVSFFLQTAFGIVAWDYSGTFGNIDGRTNFAFGCAWGFLGLVWIKLILPDVLKVVDAIPLNWRAIVTTLAAIFMLADQIVTLVALDCWYQREAGRPQTTVVQKYCAEHFDNDYMQHRFQTMNLDPKTAGRLDA